MIIAVLALAAISGCKAKRQEPAIIKDTQGGNAPFISGVGFSDDGSCWGVARKSLLVMDTGKPCSSLHSTNLPSSTGQVRVASGLGAIAYTTDDFKTVVSLDTKNGKELWRSSVDGIGVNGLAVSQKYIAYAVGDGDLFRDTIRIVERATGRLVLLRVYPLAQFHVAMGFAETDGHTCIAIALAKDVEVICGLGERIQSARRFKATESLFPLDSIALGRDQLAFGSHHFGVRLVCPRNGGSCVRLPKNGAMHQSADMALSPDGMYLADVTEGSGYAALYRLAAQTP